MSNDTPADDQPRKTHDEDEEGYTVEVGSFAETDGEGPETVTSSKPVGSFADSESRDGEEDGPDTDTAPPADDEEKHTHEVGSFDNETRTVSTSERTGSFADKDE